MSRCLVPLVPWLGAFWVGCYSPERFDEDYDLAFCEKVFECEDETAIPYLPYQTLDECVSFRTEQREEQGGTAEDEDCAYNAGVAQQCVEDLTDLACPSYTSGSFPGSCVQVCGEGT